MSEAAPKRPRHALAEALGLVQPPNMTLETVNVDGAAALLHTTRRAIYERRRSGKMPKPVTRRPLVWRRADLLALAK